MLTHDVVHHVSEGPIAPVEQVAYRMEQVASAEVYLRRRDGTVVPSSTWASFGRTLWEQLSQALSLERQDPAVLCFGECIEPLTTREHWDLASDKAGSLQLLLDLRGARQRPSLLALQPLSSSFWTPRIVDAFINTWVLRCRPLNGPQNERLGQLHRFLDHVTVVSSEPLGPDIDLGFLPDRRRTLCQTGHHYLVFRLKSILGDRREAAAVDIIVLLAGDSQTVSSPRAGLNLLATKDPNKELLVDWIGPDISCLTRSPDTLLLSGCQGLGPSMSGHEEALCSSAFWQKSRSRDMAQTAGLTDNQWSDRCARERCRLISTPVCLVNSLGQSTLHRTTLGSYILRLAGNIQAELDLAEPPLCFWHGGSLRDALQGRNSLLVDFDWGVDLRGAKRLKNGVLYPLSDADPIWVSQKIQDAVLKTLLQLWIDPSCSADLLDERRRADLLLEHLQFLIETLPAKNHPAESPLLDPLHTHIEHDRRHVLSLRMQMGVPNRREPLQADVMIVIEGDPRMCVLSHDALYANLGSSNLEVLTPAGAPTPKESFRDLQTRTTHVVCPDTFGVFARVVCALGNGFSVSDLHDPRWDSPLCQSIRLFLNSHKPNEYRYQVERYMRDWPESKKAQGLLLAAQVIPSIWSDLSIWNGSAPREIVALMEGLAELGTLCRLEVAQAWSLLISHLVLGTTWDTSGIRTETGKAAHWTWLACPMYLKTPPQGWLEPLEKGLLTSIVDVLEMHGRQAPLNLGFLPWVRDLALTAQQHPDLTRLLALPAVADLVRGQTPEQDTSAPQCPTPEQDHCICAPLLPPAELGCSPVDPVQQWLLELSTEPTDAPSSEDLRTLIEKRDPTLLDNVQRILLEQRPRQIWPLDIILPLLTALETTYREDWADSGARNSAWYVALLLLRRCKIPPDTACQARCDLNALAMRLLLAWHASEPTVVHHGKLVRGSDLPTEQREALFNREIDFWPQIGPLRELYLCAATTTEWPWADRESMQEALFGVLEHLRTPSPMSSDSQPLLETWVRLLIEESAMMSQLQVVPSILFQRLVQEQQRGIRPETTLPLLDLLHREWPAARTAPPLSVPGPVHFEQSWSLWIQLSPSGKETLGLLMAPLRTQDAPLAQGPSTKELFDLLEQTPERDLILVLREWLLNPSIRPRWTMETALPLLEGLFSKWSSSRSASAPLPVTWYVALWINRNTEEDAFDEDSTMLLWTHTLHLGARRCLGAYHADDFLLWPPHSAFRSILEKRRLAESWQSRQPSLSPDRILDSSRDFLKGASEGLFRAYGNNHPMVELWDTVVYPYWNTPLPSAGEAEAVERSLHIDALPEGVSNHARAAWEWLYTLSVADTYPHMELTYEELTAGLRDLAQLAGPAMIEQLHRLLEKPARGPSWEMEQVYPLLRALEEMGGAVSEGKRSTGWYLGMHVLKCLSAHFRVAPIDLYSSIADAEHADLYRLVARLLFLWCATLPANGRSMKEELPYWQMRGGLQRLEPICVEATRFARSFSFEAVWDGLRALKPPHLSLSEAWWAICHQEMQGLATVDNLPFWLEGWQLGRKQYDQGHPSTWLTQLFKEVASGEISSTTGRLIELLMSCRADPPVTEEGKEPTPLFGLDVMLSILTNAASLGLSMSLQTKMLHNLVDCFVYVNGNSIEEVKGRLTSAQVKNRLRACEFVLATKIPLEEGYFQEAAYGILFHWENPSKSCSSFPLSEEIVRRIDESFLYLPDYEWLQTDPKDAFCGLTAILLDWLCRTAAFAPRTDDRLVELLSLCKGLFSSNPALKVLAIMVDELALRQPLPRVPYFLVSAILKQIETLSLTPDLILRRLNLLFAASALEGWKGLSSRCQVQPKFVKEFSFDQRTELLQLLSQQPLPSKDHSLQWHQWALEAGTALQLLSLGLRDGPLDTKREWPALLNLVEAYTLLPVTIKILMGLIPFAPIQSIQDWKRLFDLTQNLFSLHAAPEHLMLRSHLAAVLLIRLNTENSLGLADQHHLWPWLTEGTDRFSKFDITVLDVLTGGLVDPGKQSKKGPSQKGWLPLASTWLGIMTRSSTRNMILHPIHPPGQPANQAASTSALPMELQTASESPFSMRVSMLLKALDHLLRDTSIELDTHLTDVAGWLDSWFPQDSPQGPEKGEFVLILPPQPDPFSILLRAAQRAASCKENRATCIRSFARANYRVFQTYVSTSLAERLPLKRQQELVQQDLVAWLRLWTEHTDGEIPSWLAAPVSRAFSETSPQVREELWKALGFLRNRSIFEDVPTGPTLPHLPQSLLQALMHAGPSDPQQRDAWRAWLLPSQLETRTAAQRMAYLHPALVSTKPLSMERDHLWHLIMGHGPCGEETQSLHFLWRTLEALCDYPPSPRGTPGAMVETTLASIFRHSDFSFSAKTADLFVRSLGLLLQTHSNLAGSMFGPRSLLAWNFLVHTNFLSCLESSPSDPHPIEVDKYRSQLTLCRFVHYFGEAVLATWETYRSQPNRPVQALVQDVGVAECKLAAVDIVLQRLGLVGENLVAFTREDQGPAEFSPLDLLVDFGEALFNTSQGNQPTLKVLLGSYIARLHVSIPLHQWPARALGVVACSFYDKLSQPIELARNELGEVDSAYQALHQELIGHWEKYLPASSSEPDRPVETAQAPHHLVLLVTAAAVHKESLGRSCHDSKGLQRALIRSWMDLPTDASLGLFLNILCTPRLGLTIPEQRTYCATLFARRPARGLALLQEMAQLVSLPKGIEQDQQCGLFGSDCSVTNTDLYVAVMKLSAMTLLHPDYSMRKSGPRSPTTAPYTPWEYGEGTSTSQTTPDSGPDSISLMFQELHLVQALIGHQLGYCCSRPRVSGKHLLVFASLAIKALLDRDTKKVTKALHFIVKRVLPAADLQTFTTKLEALLQDLSGGHPLPPAAEAIGRQLLLQVMKEWASFAASSSVDPAEASEFIQESVDCFGLENPPNMDHDNRLAVLSTQIRWLIDSAEQSVETLLIRLLYAMIPLRSSASTKA
ncbi:MAG: hypothetical protein ACOYKZ_00885 [Chlamydiia bacterium]